MAEAEEEVERLYALAKAGTWDDVLSVMAKDPGRARTCSRYARPSSGWTFLHQAAYSGHEAAARTLVGLGASIVAMSNGGESPVDVAKRRGHGELARLLEVAAATGKGLWEPAPVPEILPASSAWAEAERRTAEAPTRVGYGGAVIAIPKGSRYFVDGFGRILVGWHGSFDPPCGMDGRPMIDRRHLAR